MQDVKQLPLTMSLLRDNQLITFLRQCDTDAYAEIYHRYFQLMFEFAYKKLGDEELAKDLVQDLFVKLWERRDSLADVSNFSSYLFVMLRNSIFNHFKRNQIGERYTDFLVSYANDLDQQQPDHRIREKQLADYIAQQIQKLPKKMRKMFELSRMDYLSHKQIALHLDTSENNVKTQIMNALRILRGKMNKMSIVILFISHFL